MNIVKTTVNTNELSQIVVLGMLEKKATDIVVMDLRKVTQSIADYFVICSASSTNQADAIKDSVEDMVFEKNREWPWRKEGEQNREWILLDYVSVVVHIFRKDRREFYGLEELWGDAQFEFIESESDF
jgi:ribosome-associated protein